MRYGQLPAMFVRDNWPSCQGVLGERYFLQLITIFSLYFHIFSVE